MIKYGLISQTDARTLEKTIDLICTAWPDEIINICEIGLYNCETSIGLMNYYWQHHITDIKSINYIGIDNQKDKAIIAPEWMNLIIGNSTEVYNQIPDNSQHLIFVDGLHTFAGVIADFFCYAPKVKVGGYMTFHDTGKHIIPTHGWQGVGDENDPDMCLGGVRKALEKMGLLESEKGLLEFDWDFNRGSIGNWELIFDEADINDQAGGICVFKKLY